MATDRFGQGRIQWHMVAKGDGCLATVAMEGGGARVLEPPPIILLGNILEFKLF